MKTDGDYRIPETPYKKKKEGEMTHPDFNGKWGFHGNLLPTKSNLTD